MKIPILSTITEPTLLLDEQKCRHNIRSMAEKAKKAGLIFRPHFKTHQSQEIGRWFREVGVTKITVSSLRMAEYFAADGWKDITVAFPVNVREMERINRLAAQIQLHLLVENVESLDYLKTGLQHTVGVFIKVDIGYHRTGISPDDHAAITQLLKAMTSSDKFHFLGFLGHAGHSYKARGKAAIRQVHQQSLKAILPLKERYQDSFPELILSIGDTPTCSQEDTFEGADEIRPGNFVFYDLAQWRIGACRLDQIAVAMACPVVAKHPEQAKMVIYGGGVHFAKDQSILLDGQTPFFGHLVETTEQGWRLPNGRNYLSSLSQEHGILTVEPSVMEKYQVGDIVTILPIHACMTANEMKEYLTLKGRWITRL
ncbi:MAG: alanine racemase [Saprospiraceae bacterium]